MPRPESRKDYRNFPDFYWDILDQFDNDDAAFEWTASMPLSDARAMRHRLYRFFGFLRHAVQRNTFSAIGVKKDEWAEKYHAIASTLSLSIEPSASIARLIIRRSIEFKLQKEVKNA